MNEGRCRKHVYGGSYMGHQCSRKAVKDGYCKQHHPDAVKAKKEAREKQWEQEWAERKRRHEREKAIRSFTAGMTWDEGLTLAEVADVLRGCTEHMEWSTKQGKDAYTDAHNILSRLRTEKDKP